MLAALAASSPIAAQARREDPSVWTIGILTAPLGDKVEVTLDGHVGLNDGATRPARFFARGLVYYRIADAVQIGGGYGRFYNDEPRVPALVEGRLFVDVNYRTPERPGTTIVQLRSRLERREEESNREVAWQWCQLIRADVPLTGGERAMRLIGWHESFVALNDTRWAGRTGHAAMFHFLGLGLPVGGQTRIEAGYLNVTSFIPGRNRLRHGPALILAARS